MCAMEKIEGEIFWKDARVIRYSRYWIEKKIFMLGGDGSGSEIWYQRAVFDSFNHGHANFHVL
jgi:hypothetical protein